MKTKIERLVLISILAPLAPIAGFIGFWWSSYALLPEKWIPFCSIIGITLGILADVLILKRMITHAFDYGMIFWVIIFLFYTMGVFGFFMGVPVFNAALGLPAGFIVGGKLAHKSADRSRVGAASFKTSIFTTCILAFICTTSAALALSETTLPAQLEGMLALPFRVTWEMIWGIIIVGGAGLLAINWILTSVSVRFTHHLLSTS